MWDSGSEEMALLDQIWMQFWVWAYEVSRFNNLAVAIYFGFVSSASRFWFLTGNKSQCDYEPVL